MEKFQDVVIDPAGNALAGVSVFVKDFGTNTASTIFSDNARTPAVNPLTTDANGHFFFYAEQGRYSLDLSGGGITAKTISDLWVDDVIYALKESPAFTGNPTAPTQALTDNSTKIATTAFTAGLMSAHVAHSDPHPIYMTKTEMDQRFGGTVTQAAPMLPVTLNKNTGEIVLAAGVIASNGSIAFTLNNLTIDEHDNVVINVKSGASGVGIYQVWCDSVAKGSCIIVVKNIGNTIYSDPLKLQFTVLKGAIA